MVTKVGLWEQASDPTTVANKGYIYAKEVNSITELFYRDGSSNITQLTLEGKVKGNTLNQSYDEGGAGVGRTITIDAGPVTLVAGGLEALHADGYIGITERSGDPTLLANSGLVYTKEVTGVTELFYMNTAGVTTQLTDNGAVPGMNKIQEGNTVAEVHDTGSDGYFFVTTESGERFRIGPNGGATFTPNIDTSINFNTSGTGLGIFANAVRLGTTTDTTAGNVRWTGTHFEGYMGTAWNQLDQTAADLTSSNTSVITITDGTGAVMGTGTSISINKASSVLDGYLGKDDWATFNAKQDALTTGNITETSSDILSFTGETGAVIGTGVTIAVQKASAAQDGYLGKDDWATFNGKQDTVVTYDLSETASGILSITGGTNSVLTNDVTIQVQKASAIQDGYLGKDDFASLVSGTGITKGDVTEGSGSNVLSFSVDAADSVFGNGFTITVSQATAGTDGYLTSADWNTFNNKEDALTTGDLTSVITGVITVSGGTDAVIGTGTSISISKASAGSDGYLTSTDWSTFNGKEDALTPGTISSGTASVIDVSGGTSSTVGPNVTVSINKASAIQDGYLGKDDFASFAAASTMIIQGDTKAYVLDTGADGYFAANTNGVERFRLTFDGGMVVPSSSAAPTASNAMTYYDTDDNKFKFYENGTWNELGGTLNTAYNYGGAGAGKTITVNSGAVTLTSSGGEALHTDGYIGIVEKASDPTAVASMGSVYTKAVNGITELFYFDSTGSYTQITDDGYLATANSLYQVGLYTKDWDPHANVGEGFVYTKWVDVETDKHSELYFMDDKAQVTQMTKDGSLNVVLTSPNGHKFELSVDDEGILSTKKI